MREKREDEGGREGGMEEEELRGRGRGGEGMWERETIIKRKKTSEIRLRWGK